VTRDANRKILWGERNLLRGGGTLLRKRKFQSASSLLYVCEENASWESLFFSSSVFLVVKN